MSRWAKGQSGNPNGRPRARRPNISAFDIIFDKRLAVNRNGEDHELTVDEALELKTYQDAVKGSRMAIRQVLKMIERRERALAAKAPRSAPYAIRSEIQNDPRNADEAMLILGIAEPDDSRPPDQYGQHLKLSAWATQVAISRPGRKLLEEKEVKEVERSTSKPEDLVWPRGGKR